METLTTAAYQFDIELMEPNYKNSSLKVTGFDLDNQKDFESYVSFLELALAICPDGKGKIEAGIQHHTFDEDSGPNIDYLPISLTPLEFFGEIFEAVEEEYKMQPEQKKNYIEVMKDLLQPILKNNLSKLK